ncbi:MAG: outer membrane beta-barrel protein [Ferruginibacter sp.]
MNSRYFFPLCIALTLTSTLAESQIIYERRPPRYRMQQRPQRRQKEEAFQPSVNISVGYGFPNGDKYLLPSYYNAYSGTISQNGPITGSIDYRFNRRMSIGALITHGTVNAPYYDYSNSGIPAFNYKMENWSFMLNIMKYMPGSKNVTPYFRTAIGINSWKQDYTDAAGNKIAMPAADLPDLAYQVGLGAQIKMSNNAGFFLEAGYGKYILHGGVTLKF